MSSVVRVCSILMLDRFCFFTSPGPLWACMAGPEAPKESGSSTPTMAGSA